MAAGNSDKQPFPVKAEFVAAQGKVGQEKGGKNLAGSGKSAGSGSPQKSSIYSK